MFCLAPFINELICLGLLDLNLPMTSSETRDLWEKQTLTRRNLRCSVVYFALVETGQCCAQRQAGRNETAIARNFQRCAFAGNCSKGSLNHTPKAAPFPQVGARNPKRRLLLQGGVVGFQCRSGSSPLPAKLQLRSKKASLGKPPNPCMAQMKQSTRVIFGAFVGFRTVFWGANSRFW